MNMSTFTNVTEMKYWCYKVLPLVYDDSLSYYEVLCKATEKLNEVIENNNNIPEYIKEIVSSGGFLSGLQEQIAELNDGDSKTATADRHTGELIWLDGILYRITRNMLAGDQYVTSSEGVTGNIEKLTFEEWCERYRGLIKDSISSHDEKYNDESSASYNVGDWLWWQGAFYTVTKVIAKDDKLVVGRNVQLDNLENILVQTIKDIQSDIANEKTERQEADNKLSSDLATETSNREDADSQLSASITQEITDRTSAINTVNEALATETKNREDSDAQLSASITQEITDRTSEGAKLNGAISAEATARETADTELKTEIQQIITTDITALETKVDTEISDRKALIAGDGTNTTVSSTGSIILNSGTNVTYSKPGTYNGYEAVQFGSTDGSTYNLLTTNNVFSSGEDKYIIIGDSYGTVTEKNWITTLKSLLGEDNCKSTAEGGAGFGNGAFLRLLNTFDDDEKVTKIIVGGGANDCLYCSPVSGGGLDTTIPTAVTTFRDTARTKFPKAEIYIAFIGNVKPSFLASQYSLVPATRWFLNYQYQRLSLIDHVIVLNGLQYSNLNMDNWTDQTHPTEAYSQEIGHYVFQALKTGSVTVAGVQNGIMRIGNGSSYTDLSVFFVNNHLYVTGTSTTAMTGSFSLPALTYTDIGYVYETGLAVPFVDYETYMAVQYGSTYYWTGVYFNAAASGYFRVKLAPAATVSASSIRFMGTVFEGDVYQF